MRWLLRSWEDFSSLIQSHRKQLLEGRRTYHCVHGLFPHIRNVDSAKSSRKGCPSSSGIPKQTRVTEAAKEAQNEARQRKKKERTHTSSLQPWLVSVLTHYHLQHSELLSVCLWCLVPPLRFGSCHILLNHFVSVYKAFL